MSVENDPLQVAKQWRGMAFALFFLLAAGIGCVVYLGLLLSKRPAVETSAPITPAATAPVAAPAETTSAEAALTQKTQLYTHGTQGQIETEGAKGKRIFYAVAAALDNSSLKETRSTVGVMKSEGGKSYVEVTYEIGEVAPAERERLIGKLSVILNNSPAERLMDNWMGMDEFANYIRTYCAFLEYKADGVNSLVATFSIRGEVSDYVIYVKAFYYDRYGAKQKFTFMEARLPAYELERVVNWEHARPLDLIKLIHIDAGGPL